MSESAAPSVVVIGGYGVMGKLFCNAIREKYNYINIYIASHNLAKATEFAEELNNKYQGASATSGSSEVTGKCYGILVDIKNKNPLSSLDGLNHKVSAVIALINDSNNYIIRDACEREIPYLDIAKAGDDIIEAMNIVDEHAKQGKDVRALWGSEWFVGLPSLIAVDMSKQFELIETIQVIALMKNNDIAGPDSLEAFAGIADAYDAWINGKMIKARAFTEYVPVTYPEGFKGYAYNMDNVETFSLPKITNVQTIKFLIALDDNFSFPLVKFMCKIGLMGLLSKPSFKGLRKTLLYSPGKGANVDIILKVKGKKSASDSDSKELETRLHCEKGQTHFTNTGLIITFEYLLGLNGYEKSPKGNAFADWNKDSSRAIEQAKSAGIEFFPSN